MLLVAGTGNNFKEDFEAFLQNYAWVLCVIVVGIILLTILIVFLIKGKKNKKVEKKGVNDINEWIIALGTKENIVEVNAIGSRLSIKLKDKEKINREELTRLGVKSIVMMSDKVTLVSELDNQKIMEEMKKGLTE